MAKELRNYASFFEWFDKGQKELGIVEKLLRSLNSAYALGWHTPVIQKPDPPDCVCLTGSGERVAIEVVEVVCETATRLNALGQRVVRDWRPGDLKPHVTALLNEKDGKTYHGGPYSHIAVCLFTDEPHLALTEVSGELGAAIFGPYRQIKSMFLLFSYDPNTETYPVLTLRPPDSFALQQSRDRYAAKKQTRRLP
jgi:hypothetical protein